MNTHSRIACALVAGVLGLPAAGHVIAQQAAYPTKPIRFMIMVPPGGTVDNLARLLAQRVSVSFGQPVVVESRPGANGAIAAVALARSPADGHTVLLPSSGIVQTVIVDKTPTYSMNELAPVAKFALIPVALAIPASLPARSLKEYVAWARANPDRAEYGTTGSGSASHIMGEMLNQLAGIRMLHVPFSGGQPAIAAILGGQISATFGVPGSLGSQKGALRMLAVTAPNRLRDFPEIPTFTEAGYTELNQPGWIGAFVPAKTPQPRIDRLSQEFLRILSAPEVEERVHSFGFVPEPAGTAEFARFVEAETKTWTSLVQRTKVRVD